MSTYSHNVPRGALREMLDALSLLSLELRLKGVAKLTTSMVNLATPMVNLAIPERNAPITGKTHGGQEQ